MEFLRFLIPLGLFAAIFGVFFLRSRENMALIEKGLNPRKENGLTSNTSMKYGLLLIGAGLGLLAAYLIELSIPKKGFSMGPDNPALYFALVAIGGGLGLFISYLLERKNKPADKGDE